MYLKYLGIELSDFFQCLFIQLPQLLDRFSLGFFIAGDLSVGILYLPAGYAIFSFLEKAVYPSSRR